MTINNEPVGEIVSWKHPIEKRQVAFRWFRFDVEPGTKLYAARPALGLHFSTPAELAAMLDHVSCFHELSAELIAEEIFKGAIPQPVTEVDDLVMHIRRLVHSLNKHNPGSKLAEQVTDYMRRNGYFQTTDCLRIPPTPTSQRIEPMEPQRDTGGWWTHPDFAEPADGNEYFAPGELEAWLEAQGVECSTRLMDDEVEPGSPAALAWENLDCDCAAWSPQSPEGEGWFLVSIHDTEDGPCALWLRRKDGDA